MNTPEYHPFIPTVAFNICCPRDCVSRTANVGTVGTNGLMDQTNILNFEVKLKLKQCANMKYQIMWMNLGQSVVY